MDEQDPKHSMKVERYKPSTEKILRQFLSLESCNANNKSFVEGHERAFHEKPVELDPAVHCTQCDYVAKTVAEMRWHTKSCGHEMGL